MGGKVYSLLGTLYHKSLHLYSRCDTPLLAFKFFKQNAIALRMRSGYFNDVGKSDVHVITECAYIVRDHMNLSFLVTNTLYLLTWICVDPCDHS